jgi:ribosomal protein S25
MSPQASKKKWTKTQSKEKREWASVLQAPIAARIENEVPRQKVITPNRLAATYSISLTLARKVLKQLVADGKLEVLQSHHTLDVYGRGSLPEPAAVVDVPKVTGEGDGKKAQKQKPAATAKPPAPKAAPKKAEGGKKEGDKKDAKKK